MILLVDGNNIFYRQYYKLKTLDNGGVYGFLKFIFSENLPKHDLMVVCWDYGRSKRRMEIYPDYKKNRKHDTEESEEMFSQIDMLYDFLGNLGVVQVRIDGVEADDIIASLTKRFFKVKKVGIVSSDTDFIQLLKHENVKIFDPKNDYQKMNMDSIGYEKKDYSLLKSIVGDASDNIKGVLGIGPKRAQIYVNKMTEDKNYNKYKELIEKDWNIVTRNLQLIDFSYIPKELSSKIFMEFKNGLNKRVKSKSVRRTQFETFIKENFMNSLLGYLQTENNIL